MLNKDYAFQAAQSFGSFLQKITCHEKRFSCTLVDPAVGRFRFLQYLPLCVNAVEEKRLSALLCRKNHLITLG